MTQAQRYQALVAKAFARYGETLSLYYDGADHAVTGVFAPLDNTTANIYFDANETIGLVRPGGIFYLPGTARVPLVGETLTRDQRLYVVRRVDVRRVSGVPLVILVILD